MADNPGDCGIRRALYLVGGPVFAEDVSLSQVSA